MRARAERRRELARHKRHYLAGKLHVYSSHAGRPDGRPSLNVDDLAVEVRRLTAKATRVQQAIHDIEGSGLVTRAGAVPSAREACTRCYGALLVLAQLRDQPGDQPGWMGAARADESTDGGLAMAWQLLQTRHRRLSEAADEDEQRVSSRERLLNQLDELRGQIRAVGEMRELAISLEARDLARELALPSSAKQRAAECVEVAAERAQTVQRQEIPIADEMLRKLDDEIIELARADHDYEQVCASAPSLDCSSMHVLTTAPRPSRRQVCGSIALLDSALATLVRGQQSLIEAIRLCAFGEHLALQPSRAAALARRRWLRELGASELAFAEVVQRQGGPEETVALIAADGH